MKQLCAICATRSDDVGPSLVRWRDPLPGQQFDSVWRCRDRVACRDRCEAAGDIWPIDDGTPATVPVPLG